MEEDKYVKALKKYKYKITPQRLAVIDYIKHNPGHFTAEEVYRNIKRTEPTITLATVYNIFKAMKASEIIQSFEANGATIYETNRERHANFICSSCGRIEDIEVPSLNFVDRLSERGMTVDSVEMVIRGYCESCQTHLAETGGATAYVESRMS